MGLLLILRNDKDLYGLRYAEFVVPLVKAVQELSKQNEKLQQQINELKLRVNGGGSMKGFLKQNIPNPAAGNTIIEYFVPEQARTAQLVLLDAGGRTVKAFSLPSRGVGQLSFSTAGFPAGMYVYTLIVDGEKADSRQLITAK